MKTGAALQINLFGSKPTKSDDSYIESMRYDHRRVCALFQSKAIFGLSVERTIA
jgi:hypothetical protein